MELIQYQQDAGVGVLTINRPGQLNALNSAVLRELEQKLDGLELSSLRCLILTGAGEKAFVAGADVREMMDFSQEEAAGFSRNGNRIFRKLELFAAPVIAAVNGYALGGGCELALSCDIRLCSENAVFGQPEVSLGITPGFGGTQRLARVVGASRARELILSGISIKAQRALEIGLVNAVYPGAELMEQAHKLAKRIAAHPTHAVRAAKAAIEQGADLPMDQGIEVEVEQFSGCFTNPDQKTAMEAFVNKK